MKTLILTTPHIKGPEVTRVQTLLKNHGWLTGSVDGEFGPDSARSCKRAKYWLGYPMKNITGTAGDTLVGLLDGSIKPGRLYVMRANARRKAAAETPLRVKAFNEAQKFVGITENPAGSNHQQFGVWYGFDRVPWCAIFCTYCYVNAGSQSAFKRGSRWAYVPYLLHDAIAGVNYVAITYQPQKGDLVLFDWDGDKVPDHVGMFEAWVDANSFSTIEGNTSGDDSGSQSNGGMVAHRKVHPRYRANVRAFVHVSK